MTTSISTSTSPIDVGQNQPLVKTDTLVAICTYQEAGLVESMLVELRRAFPDAVLLVVDDNSPDGTAGIVEQVQKRDPKVRLLVRKDRRGLGSAIVDAMRIACDGGYEFFLNLDADLSHSPAEMPKLLQRAKQDDELAVVIGSRYVQGGRIVGWPLKRRVMSKLVNRFATGVLRLPVHDCSGSMRCYRTTALRDIQLDSLKCVGYAVLEEVLVRLHRRGYRFDEVPITFTERQIGESKLSLPEAFRSIGYMFRLALESKD
ncbi:polyprenol monophosphomannose synthase [Rhodopirellula sp. MGV]|uniref:polyprenol monophosphomannose synthase n=1 Tax=Rhodopirellula sp. MGV TaxID=2023130 RepID=UPI002100ACFE|nr:polyprenol monophosphomannose synthase [Rhodopirellula sp. MGV]